ncbi:MAG TPA: winged helix-turn-helix domain-containing protein [Candidatus Polarisedimenticolia bacterium]|nr:winged helix-turn-helix domain-containing protein [Candidatus Polarisedimenticolia bacterium]
MRFGPAHSEAGRPEAYELDQETLDLRRDGETVAIRPQSIRVLALLLRRGGRLVTIDELRRELWGDQHLEWRNGLHQCVRDLRRALEDDPARPRFVATVARRGYRFVGESVPVEVLPESGPPARNGSAPVGCPTPPVVFAAGATVALLLTMSLFVLICVILAR